MPHPSIFLFMYTGTAGRVSVLTHHCDLPGMNPRKAHMLITITFV